MQLDTDQFAVYNTDCNAVISAGAGSGKTTVLTERYIRLIIEKGFDTSEVLALTFTRKATTEMYARIYKKLSESQSKYPQAAEQLLHFDQARIATLDSFCNTIVKGAAYQFGISGDFRVDDREVYTSAKEAALALVMQHRHTESVRTMVASRSFETVVNKLFAGIGMHVCSLVRKGAFAEKAQKQVELLKQRVPPVLERMDSLCRMILAVDDADCSNDSSRKVKAAIKSIYPLPSEHDDAQTLFKLAQSFVDRPSLYVLNGVSQIKKECLQELKGAATELKNQAAPELKVLASMLRFQEDILSVGAILDEYEALFLNSKRQKAVLSFHDLTELAIEILRNDLNLRNYYKQHIKAIMIDEFQDNNRLQKELLYLLAERLDTGTACVQPGAADIEPDKLFFVGDEKQSIYRFRGADVSVFRNLSHELNNPLSLSTNYRSNPALVAFYNALFPGVFGTPTKDFEAAFCAMKPAPDKKLDPDAMPVEIYIQETESEEKGNGEDSEEEPVAAQEAEAFAVARRIIAGLAAKEFSLGDLAILFRKTTHQNTYERLFRRIGIPFDAADPRGIFAEGPANDIYALLRLSLFPQDRNAYATVLRSPFVNLSDTTFFSIMLDTCADVFPDNPDMRWFASPKDHERYLQGADTFNQLKGKIDLQGIAPTMAYLWYETGYRTALLYNKKYRHNSEHFEHIYRLALDADMRRMNMAAFLDELAPLMGSTDKVDGGEVTDQSDRVRFLTVHKSKGLEFKVVVLANAGYSGKSERNDLPYYVDPDYGVTINFKMDTETHEQSLNYFYEQNRKQLSLQEQAEVKRLFYVAATRAKEKLLIFSTYKLTKAMKEKLEGKSGTERLEALINTPRLYADGWRKGQRRTDTFLDLLSCGFACAAIPHCKLLSFSCPSVHEQERYIQNLHSQFVQLTGVESADDVPEWFYALPQAQEKQRHSIQIFNPSELDTAPDTEGLLLPSFDCDPLLADGTDPSEYSRRFGTLCHEAIAGILEDSETDTTEELVKKARSLFGEQYFLEKKLHKLSLDAKQFAREAQSAARRFIQSPLGEQVRASAKFLSEFKFLLPLAVPQTKRIGFLLEGSIDLIYEHDKTCVVVDFKVDRKKVQDAHRLQMACYRAAAPAFSSYPVRTMVVYLRSMEAVFVENDMPNEALYNEIASKKSATVLRS
ncbi:MAG: UvrD-helicase domain-containing protein [Spirochaetaceae bacterium]|jgi:ATP-dependent helicase/nuclease subunit A|nr:UvrD-helicase domain-containing protein [Spirochaetaceae bacterium]